VLDQLLEGAQVSDPGARGEAAWSSLDARVDGVVNELRAATTLDDLQDVGRRCREILIDTARLIADPALVPAGREPLKAADAKLGWSSTSGSEHPAEATGASGFHPGGMGPRPEGNSWRH